MKKYKFKAKIESESGGGAYILFPYDTEKEFGIKGRVPIQATFDDVPYTGSLIKYGHPQHMLGLLKAKGNKAQGLLEALGVTEADVKRNAD